MDQKKTTWYYIWIFVVAFLAMLPVVLFQHPLKYDMIDQAYPWRYFIGECLQEGILPLWNPYQLLGSPIHADPQSSAWYPVTWFIGFIFGYDIYTISVDFFLHIFLAGMGMFYLGRQLRFRNETAFLMAVSYMLSGFFTGNAQHFMWIISGTWLPFILGAFLALREKPSTDGAIRLGLSFFMILSGGYPAFVFLLVYLMTAVFILFAWDYFKKNQKKSFYRFTGFTALAAVLTILMSAVVLISVFHVQDAMTRGAGVTLKQALFGAFTPKSFISFILPFASIRNMDYYGTDLSMSNAYFGLVTMVFFIAALTIRRSRLINLFLVWGIFCLLAAAGSALPVREFLYHFIPAMDQFRFPALFRIYIILSFILVAGSGFDAWLNGHSRMTQRIKWVTTGLGGVILGFFLYRLFTGTPGMRDFLRHELFIASDKSTIGQHILLQSFIQMVLLGLFLIAVLKRQTLKYALYIILTVVCLDLVMATRLNGPYTVYYHLFKSKEVYAHARQFPDGFPVPGKGRIIDNKDQLGLVFQALWRNLNIFHKQVSYEGYNPLHLTGFEEMADNHTKLFETILQNPLVYQAARISPLDSIPVHEQKGDFDPGRIYFDAGAYQALKNEGFYQSAADSISISHYTPVEIRAASISDGKVLANLLQNNYHGWKATIDGEPADIITGNMSFISVPVPAGRHEVVFSYDPDDVKIGFYMTVLTIIGSLIVFAGTRKIS